MDATGIRKVLGLVDESKKKNIAIVAGTQRRHQTGYIETMKRIHDGAIGDIVAARCSWNGDGIWFHDRQQGRDRRRVPDPQLVPLPLAVRRPHRRAARPQPRRDQLGHGRPPGEGGRHGRPGGPQGRRPERGRQHLGPLRGRVRVQERRAALLVLPPHPGRRTTCPRRSSGPRARASVERLPSINGEPGRRATTSTPYVQEHIDLLNSIRAGKPLNELKNVTDSTFTADPRPERLVRVQDAEVGRRAGRGRGHDAEEPDTRRESSGQRGPDAGRVATAAASVMSICSC